MIGPGRPESIHGLAGRVEGEVEIGDRKNVQRAASGRGFVKSKSTPSGLANASLPGETNPRTGVG